MARCFKVMALLLALLWGPMTSHCALEQLPGLALLACGDSADSEPHQETDCGTDVCASVESGLYKTEEQSAIVLAPCLIAAWFLPAEGALSFDLHGSASPAPATEPELARCWLFTLRLAPSPRAPSSAV